MEKQKRQNLKNSKGITLLALVITIIVLLILAGIMISTLVGDNGLINKVIEAKEQTEISKEQEIVNISAVKAIGKNKYGRVTKTGLEKALSDEIGNDIEEVIVTDIENGNLTVVFLSERVYQVDRNGNVTYLGTEQEVAAKVIINTNEEKNTTPELIQEVEVQVKSYVEIEDEDITLIYAWSKSKEEMPEDSEFVAANLSGTKFNRTATIYSDVTDQANYYLWVKAIVTSETGEEIETAKVYGEYAIKEHTTLKSCSSEGSSTSTFLGMPIQRNLIKSVTISSDLQGHSKDDGTCYDVSASQKGAILGWYTEEVVDDTTTYYNVTIAENGGVVANTNSSNLFRYIGYEVADTVTIEGLENLDTSNVTDMGYMFDRCSNVTNLDLSSFNTSKVTSMYQMFSYCNNLTSLDISNFNTSKVTSMASMFGNCSKLTNLDLSHFNTENVENMYYMFAENSSLTELDVSNFNTAKVQNMQFTFTGCKNLTTLDVSGFNTENVTSMGWMFQNCNSLEVLDVSNFNTSKVKTMANMFYKCSNVGVLDVDEFDTTYVENMGNMFDGCSKVEVLDVTKFKTSNVGSMGSMFNGCSSLKALDISKFDTSNVTFMNNMFYGCSALKSLILGDINTTQVTDMRSMFNGCSALTELDISGLDTDIVTNMSNMFNGCSSLIKLDLSTFNTSLVTNVYMMFRDCKKLEYLNLKNWNIESVSNCNFVFNRMSSDIITVYVSTEDMKTWVLENSSFADEKVIVEA